MPSSPSEHSVDLSALLRGLPAVDEICRWPALVDVPRKVLVHCARAWLDSMRNKLRSGELSTHQAQRELAAPHAEIEVLRLCALRRRPRHATVLNATGIVLHTGIGRAPLPAAAIAAITAACGYAIVEVDPLTGERDQRELGVARLLCELTGAGGALVVNNNAAATTLMLAALCAGKEVVISRGELVEIGGGFRVPDVMRRAGCTMVEVGATNKTHLADFTGAVNERTVAFLKVHPSNFRITGFASTPSVAELRAQAGDLLVLDDLGSGLLCEQPIAGLAGEPRVADSLAGGAHVTCFSGDKLLGGPQCGILLGDAALIARCRSNPLYRALRCDKLTLAALEATLGIYRDGEPLQEIPSLRMLAAELPELRARSEQLAALLGTGKVVASESFAGSGANPAKAMPSFAVALRGSDQELAALRHAQPIALFARLSEGRLLLDARTLLLADLEQVAALVLQVLPRLRA